MRLSTQLLTGRALDLAVAMSLGIEVGTYHERFRRLAEAGGWDPAKTDRHLAGVEDHVVMVDFVRNMVPLPTFSVDNDAAMRFMCAPGEEIALAPVASTESKCHWAAGRLRNVVGPSPIVAIMRMKVYMVHGDEIDIPDDLLAKLPRADLEASMVRGDAARRAAVRP